MLFVSKSFVVLVCLLLSPIINFIKSNMTNVKSSKTERDRETLKKSSKIKGLSDESEKLSDNFKTFESNDIFCKEGKSLSL